MIGAMPEPCLANCRRAPAASLIGFILKFDFKLGYSSSCKPIIAAASVRLEQI
jgi:hypothetical protein